MKYETTNTRGENRKNDNTHFYLHLSVRKDSKNYHLFENSPLTPLIRFDCTRTLITNVFNETKKQST